MVEYPACVGPEGIAQDVNSYERIDFGLNRYHLNRGIPSERSLTGFPMPNLHPHDERDNFRIRRSPGRIAETSRQGRSNPADAAYGLVTVGECGSRLNALR